MLRYLTAGESHGQGAGRHRRRVAGRPGDRRRPTSSRSWPAAASGSAADRGCASSRTRSPSSGASATAARSGRRSPSRSPTPSGRSGRRRCRPPRASPSKVLTQPRPGHADLAGMQKYGFDDARDVLERASARETAARVAAGSLAKAPAGRAGCQHSQPRHPARTRACERAAPAARRPATGWTSRRSAASTPRPRRG